MNTCVGIDLHRRRSVVVRMTGAGEVLEIVRVDNDPVALSLALAKAGPDPEVVLEATYGWYWAADLLQACVPRCIWPIRWGSRCSATNGSRPMPATPGTWPSCCAWVGSPRPGWPRRRVRELRELVRYRAKLVALRSGLKAQVHAMLAKEGVRVPMSDLFGVAGTRLLDELRLGRASGLRVAWLRRLLVVSDREITMLVRQISSAWPAMSAIWPSRPSRGGAGVGGRPCRRDRQRASLAGAPQLCSWAGLTPRHHESDTTVRRGPITKQGPRLVRWAAVEATQRLPRTSKQAADFHRIATGAAPASAASPPPAGCSPWSTTACATARSAAWQQRQGRRDEWLGRSPARARVCHDPAQRRGRPLIEPARLWPHSSMPPWRGEGMTGTRARAALGQRLLAVELPPTP